MRSLWNSLLALALLAGLGGTAQAQLAPCSPPIAPNIQSGTTYTVNSNDRCQWVILTSTQPVTVKLPAPGLFFPPGFTSTILPVNGAVVQLTNLPDDAGHTHLVNLAATLATIGGQGFDISVQQDSNWYALATFAAAPTGTQIHQNGGCTSYPTGFVVNNCNVDLVADHLTIQTRDASIISYANLGGSKTTGDVVGLNWTIAGVVYQIRYTVQSADTLATIGTNLAACINAGGATHCTVTSGFLAALLAFTDSNGFGYRPQASMTTSTRMAYDQPWGASNSVASFLSGGATETFTQEANNTLDNGPYIGQSRYVPGRTPVAGDQLGTHYFQGQSSANSGIDTQYAFILPRVLVSDATNPQGELIIATASATSAKNTSPNIFIGTGVVFADSAGTSCGYLGLGIVRVCTQLSILSSTLPQVKFESQPGSDLQMHLNGGDAGRNVYFQFRDGGTNKFQLVKDTANNFSIFDNVRAVNALQVTNGGVLKLGETGDVTIAAAGGVTLATTLTVGSGATFSSTINTVGAVVVGTTLTVGSGATLSSTLNVTGATVLSNSLTVGLASTFSSNLAVGGTFMVTQASPASGAACNAGQIVGDATYLYTCSASGAWKRVAMTGGY